MGAAKIKISKDWWSENPKVSKKSRQVHKFEQARVTKTEDLPVLLTAREAAKILNCHPKTVEEYRNGQKLRFLKRGGRYFTTPEWIADFIDSTSEMV